MSSAPRHLALNRMFFFSSQLLSLQRFSSRATHALTLLYLVLDWISASLASYQCLRTLWTRKTLNMDSASMKNNFTFQIFWEGTWTLLMACLVHGTHVGFRIVLHFRYLCVYVDGRCLGICKLQTTIFCTFLILMVLYSNLRPARSSRRL
jgi:hypothetical protein